MRKGNKSWNILIYIHHMFFKIKFNATAKKRKKSYNNMIITRHSRAKKASSLLDDREIITAMRYNFDIKNSLFEYWIFSFRYVLASMPYTQNTPELRASSAFQLYNLISLGVLNDFLFFTAAIKKISSEINRAIHFLLQIILMPSYFLDVFFYFPPRYPHSLLYVMFLLKKREWLENNTSERKERCKGSVTSDKNLSHLLLALSQLVAHPWFEYLNIFICKVK